MNAQLFFIAAMSSLLAIGCSESTKEDTGAADDLVEPNADMGGTDGSVDDGSGTDDAGTDDGGSDGSGTTGGATTSGSTDGAGGSSDGSAPPGSDDGGASDGIGGLGDEGPPIDEGGGEETGDGETDGGDDDSAAGDEGGETGEVPDTDTEIDDVDTDIADSTSAGVDVSDCSLIVEYDEDADGEWDRFEGFVWDSDENLISEYVGYPSEDSAGTPATLLGYQNNEFDGDCQTLDAYYIGYVYADEPETIYYEYLEQYVYTCDDKGEFAGFVYSLDDRYTDEALADGEGDTDSQEAVATNTYNDRDQIIAQTTEYYDAEGVWFLSRELTQTFDGDELDSYEIEWVEADEEYDGLYADDSSYQVDARDEATNLVTAARWYNARGDVIQNGTWSYDASGNTLEGRVWLDGEYDLTETYEYDSDGNQVYHDYFEAVSGESYEEEWAFDADGNQVSYAIDNPDEDEVYTLLSSYDTTEYTRLIGQIYDLDSDELDDFKQSVVYSTDSFPWSYDAELFIASSSELYSTESGEYTCGDAE